MTGSFVTKVVGLIGAVVLILMLTLTSPTEIGPLGVLVFFTTLYVTIFCALSILLKTFLRLAFKREVMRRKDYLSAAVMAFAPIMVMMARSFGAVNLWTMSLVVIFVMLAEFLVYKKA